MILLLLFLLAGAAVAQPPATNIQIGTTNIGGGTPGDCLIVGPTRKLAQQACGSTPPSADCTPVTGFSHCRVITISHLQIPSTLTNFPVIAWRNFTLGSSRIQNANCYDVIFTSDSTGASKVPWEIIKCDQATGAMVVAFLDASASSTTDGLFYVSYQNAGISSPQNTGIYSAANVWNSNYKTVIHGGDGTTLSIADTTGTFTGTNHGMTETAGQLAGALAGDSNLAQYVDYGATGTIYSPITIAVWVNATAVSTGTNQIIYGKGFVSPNDAIQLELNSNAAHFGFISYDGSFHGITSGSSTVSTSTWYRVVGTYGSSTWKLYVNGISDGTSSDATGPLVSTAGWALAGQLNPPNPVFGFLGGAVSEVYVMNTAMTPDWITAEYNNQKTGSTFVTLGSEI